MQIGIFEILGGLAAFVLLLYYYFTSTFNFWEKRGVVGPKPTPMYGNFKDIMFGKASMGEYIKSEYDKYRDEPMFGVFAMRRPILVLNDPELIKDVLVKNFWSFANRGIRMFEKVEPLSANLINLEAARWKPLRAKQTTIFTSSKLKEMFYLLLECANHLEENLAKSTEINQVVECCEVSARYTTDVIGACIFGLDMKALEDEDSQFRKIGRKVIHADGWRLFKIRFKQICPLLYNLLRPIMYDYEINDFFIGLMTKTMKHRRQNNIRRNDFVDLLNDLKDHSDKLKDIELTDTLLTAQAFAFFFAGFDTSSLSISHALYELALNHSLQDKLRDEINIELAKNNGKLEYGSIENMKYLHKVFCETLRKYPVTPFLTRQSMEPYTFHGSQVSIPKGIHVWIPVYGIHRDPKIYPNPDIFDPERFSEENVRERHSSYYLPFGAGPRNCIGLRFGNHQSKVGLVTILKNYKVDVCAETPIPYVNNRRRFLVGPANGIHLKFTKLE